VLVQGVGEDMRHLGIRGGEYLAGRRREHSHLRISARTS
jgi:hypothetical protein